MNILTQRCLFVEQAGWLELRLALWPHCSRQEHLTEMAAFISEPGRYAQWIAYTNSAIPVGLIEAALRHDYVNGTETTPVAFLEGIYVVPEYRRMGIARQLVAIVAEWGMAQGCREFASYAPLENELSHALHKALGFEETERVVYFRKQWRQT